MFYSRSQPYHNVRNDR